jgi:putative intracellular protease/amidase
MKTITSILSFVILATFCHAQPHIQDPKTVAIFLYEGVELLDFAGPGEVFSSSGFQVFTVSVDGKDLVSQRFLTVKPQYSIENCPAPDIIVFPGGASRTPANDSRVINWIRNRNTKGTFFMSVCTGAGILAKSDVLNSFKNVTTFHGYIPDLQKELPQLKVLADTRFVDNQYVITTAGVSAGIDGALHLVARIKGMDQAKATAYYMEYDKWDPTKGLVDKVNPAIAELRQGKVPSGTDLPYAGEYANLSAELQGTGDFHRASFVVENGLKIYPTSGVLFDQLTVVNKKLGKPSPLSSNEITSMVKEGKTDEMLTRVAQDRKAFPNWPSFNEDNMNLAAYYLLNKKEYDNAVKVFQLITHEYPNSWNAFDSLGEAYLAAGNTADAKLNYQKSLDLYPNNDNAKKVLAQIQ